VRHPKSKPQLVKQKLINFLRDPHFPYFLLDLIRRASPRAARLIQYGRYNPNTAEYWNRRYSSGEYEIQEFERYGQLRQQVIDLIRPGSRVLDVGCGAGGFLVMLQEQKSCQCVGIDISDVAVSVTCQRGFQAYVAKLPQLPKQISDASFDACVLLETLEHISNPIRTIGQIARVLKPGGSIIVSVPNNCMPPEEFDEHVVCFDQESMRNLLSRYFQVELCSVLDAGGFQYLIASGRKVN